MRNGLNKGKAICPPVDLAFEKKWKTVSGGAWLRQKCPEPVKRPNVIVAQLLHPKWQAGEW